MEAVKQGSACVGARSKTHAVMAALKRSTNDMSSYQKKIFKVDDHMVRLPLRLILYVGPNVAENTKLLDRCLIAHTLHHTPFSVCVLLI